MLRLLSNTSLPCRTEAAPDYGEVRARLAAVLAADPAAGGEWVRLAWQVSCDWLSRGHVTTCSPLIGPPVCLHLPGDGLPGRLQRRQDQVGGGGGEAS